MKNKKNIGPTTNKKNAQLVTIKDFKKHFQPGETIPDWWFKCSNLTDLIDNIEIKFKNKQVAKFAYSQNGHYNYFLQLVEFKTIKDF